MSIDLIPAPAEPKKNDVPSPELATKAARAAEALMLLVATAFLTIHFVHLKADFPNHTLWGDWSKYTDEGWYGDAAIRQIQLGHWYVAGDFNPAVALPVWPALELLVFRFSGVNVTAARALAVAVFGLSLVCCCLLVRRWPVFGSGSSARSLAPALAVLLLAVNPMCFAFSRLAILEPLLILLTLAALLAASAAGTWSAAAADAMQRTRHRWRSLIWAVVLGLLLPLMVLTKTSAVSLLPAPFWMLWAASGYRIRTFLRPALVAGGVGAAVWAAYYGVLVRPHYLADYRYLFNANTFTGITRDTFWSVLSSGILDLQWIGEVLFLLALVAVAASAARICIGGLRAERLGQPLTETLLVWIFGYAAFLAYHANLSPRYYVVLTIPLAMLVAIFFAPVVAGAFRARPANATAGTAPVDDMLFRLPGIAAGLALLFVIFNGARQTMQFVLHPEYMFVNAAEQIQEAVAKEHVANPGHSSLVMSISGAQLSLMTGLESICDDFGTIKLPVRLATYDPGWFVAWNDVEDDKMAALAPSYRLVRVAAYPALDDPQRNLLILYRLDPLTLPQAAQTGH